MFTGKNLIAGEPVDTADGTFAARGGLADFEETSSALIDRALDAAARAFDGYRRTPAEVRAAFLDRIAAEIEASDTLIEVAHIEPAAIESLLDWLPSNRIKSIDLARLMAERPWLPSVQKSNASARA